MNTIQLSTQIDITRYVKDAVTNQEIQQDANLETQINDEVPARGTQQYDELKSVLINARLPVTDENIKTANLMIKSGIEVQKENMEAATNIKQQLEYIINHASEDSVKSIVDNKMSLDKITIDVLENVIRDVNENKSQIKAVTKEEVKKATDKYAKENDLKDKKEIDDVSKCIENLLQQGLPITNKNIQILEAVVSKSEEIKSADKDIVINLLKKGKDTTIENIYVSKFSSNKKYSTQKTVDDKTWKQLLPQIEKLVDTPKFENKQEAIEASKLLLENEIPITEQNISEIIDIEKLQTDGIDTDKLLQETVKNLKSDKSPSDIELKKVIKNDFNENTKTTLKSATPNKQVSSKQQQSKQIQDNQTTKQKSIVEYDIKKQRYEQLVKEISQYDEDVINRVLDGGGDLTLKNLHMALEQLKQEDKTENVEQNHKINDSQLTSEQREQLKNNIEKELKTVTAKRQLAEVQLRLTSEAMSTLIQKGIDIDTMSLKDIVDQLKSIEKDLYKTHLEIAGAETSTENVEQMKDLYDKLSNITDLSAPTYQEIVHRDIPFTVTALSDAEQINANNQLLQLQQASDTYENLQTQPNPKFKESFSKVADQVEPLLNDLNIETTEENIRAAKILVKNKMEVNEENILDIKLIDSKVTEVTTQLHPTIAANMIRDGLKPAQMNIDDVIKYMNKFENLLGEDLSQKISSYIYEMDKANELTQPERETMIGIYRMLYTIDKTQGRATGFVVKNNMDLTLNNLMEAANYYDRTNARYTDIDVKIDDKFGTVDKIIVDEKSIKAQLNKAYENTDTTVETKTSDEISLTKINLDEDTSIKTVAKNISLNDIIKLVKVNDDIFNIPIKELPKHIQEASKLLNVKDNQQNTDKPLSQLDIDDVIETTNNIKTLTAENKKDIFKIYNLIRNIQVSDDKAVDIDKPIQSSNENKVNTVNLQQNDNNKITISKSNEIKDFINNISVNDIVNLASNYKNIKNVTLNEIKNYIDNAKLSETDKLVISDVSESEIDKMDLPEQTKQSIKDIKESVDIINNADVDNISLKDTLNDITKNLETSKIVNKLIQSVDINTVAKLQSIDTMPLDSILDYIKQNPNQNKPLIENNTDEISNYINRNDINKEQKDTILKLYNVFNAVQNSDNKVLSKIDTQLDINTLAKAVDDFKSSNKSESNDLLQNITFENVKNAVQQNANISDFHLDKLTQYKSKPLVQTSTSDLINYISNDNLSLDEKNSIVKIYDVINTLAVSDNQNFQDIKTFGDLEKLAIDFKQAKQEVRIQKQKENDVDEFIQTTNLDKLINVTKKYNDIENMPISKIAEDMADTTKSETTNITKMDTKAIEDYINKSDLTNEQKQQVIKITNTIKNLTSNKNIEIPININEDLTVTKLIETDKLQQTKKIVDDFIKQIDLDKLIVTAKKYNDIESTPISKVVEDIENIPTFKTTDISKMDTKAIENYINKSDLTQKQKQELIKIADSIKNLAENKEDIQIKSDDQITIKTLVETDKLQQIKRKIDNFIKQIDLDKLSILIKNHEDIETVEFNKLEQEIKIQEPKDITLENLDLDKIFDYINKSKTLTQNQKDNILKVYNTIDNISNTDIDALKFVQKNDNEINLKDLKQSVDKYIEQKDVEYTNEQNKNILNKFIENITPDKLLELTKKYSNIKSVPVKELVKNQNSIFNNERQSVTINDIDFKLNHLTQEQKDILTETFDMIKTIKSSINDVKISDNNFTLDTLAKQINKNTTNIDNSKLEELKNNLNEFIQKADKNVITNLAQNYNKMKSFTIDKLIDYINKISLTNKVSKNIISKSINDISKKLDDVIQVAKALDINNIINQSVEKHENLTLDNFIELVESTEDNIKSNDIQLNVKPNNLFNENETSQVQQFENYETKQDEYNKTVLAKFIQVAEPEIISKVIKQYTAIENVPIENLLKSMELIQADKISNSKSGIANDDRVKDFLESLTKISKAEPATMLWLQKQGIPLTINNIETVQNFIKNPFWLGEQLNQFSKDLKNKLGESKDISKAVSKKNLSDLKKGKTATELLEDLEEEIIKAKKDIIKLPEQERQNLWKQSSSLEKAIEIQKQIQKDEMIYQIPMELHNGLTNMNLYVLNDKQGNGKLEKDEMKVFLSMNTETLGTVQIYMKMTDKLVSFQINSDNTEATKFLQGQQSALQSSIENLGYMVGKMYYGQEQQKSPLQTQIQTQRPIGRNISNYGFEAIM